MGFSNVFVVILGLFFLWVVRINGFSLLKIFNVFGIEMFEIWIFGVNFFYNISLKNIVFFLIKLGIGNELGYLSSNIDFKVKNTSKVFFLEFF